ncbi:atherin-like [Mastomys coucha]|uniref:atherin-like n=1 Tax=Mastomys coucha TaxID=35658 RepID=UPI0012615CCD|nr:atherin-like [Mastomys coucha]
MAKYRKVLCWRKGGGQTWLQEHPNQIPGAQKLAAHVHLLRDLLQTPDLHRNPPAAPWASQSPVKATSSCPYRSFGSASQAQAEDPVAARRGPLRPDAELRVRAARLPSGPWTAAARAALAALSSGCSKCSGRPPFHAAPPLRARPAPAALPAPPCAPPGLSSRLARPEPLTLRSASAGTKLWLPRAARRTPHSTASGAAPRACPLAPASVPSRAAAAREPQRPRLARMWCRGRLPSLAFAECERDPPSTPAPAPLKTDLDKFGSLGGIARPREQGRTFAS